jgi:hypothetical protein
MEIIAVCSEIHAKRMNKLRRQNKNYFNVKPSCTDGNP